MKRLLGCIVLVLGFTACEAGDTDERDAALHGRVQALAASLDDAGERAARLARRLERETARKVALRAEVRRMRGVDLWTGGPTIGGAFLPLPRLGTFSWTCDDRRFHVGFETAGASVRVAYGSPGGGESRMLHSNGEMSATVASGETVTWTITHRHPPGFIRATVDVTAARGRHGDCFLPAVRLEQTSRLYD